MACCELAGAEARKEFRAGAAVANISPWMGLSIEGNMHDHKGTNLHDQLHARCVVLVEASEESASTDLPEYIDLLADRIGDPDLVVCLDSGCGTYDRLWLTTSLRGLVAVDVTVRVLREGVHSGAAGGLVPSTFRVLRDLLDRIEDVETGVVTLPELHVDIPEDRAREMAMTASELGARVAGEFPFVEEIGRASCRERV